MGDEPPRRWDKVSRGRDELWRRRDELWRRRDEPRRDGDELPRRWDKVSRRRDKVPRRGGEDRRRRGKVWGRSDNVRRRWDEPPRAHGKPPSPPCSLQDVHCKPPTGRCKVSRDRGRSRGAPRTIPPSGKSPSRNRAISRGLNASQPNNAQVPPLSIRGPDIGSEGDARRRVRRTFPSETGGSASNRKRPLMSNPTTKPAAVRRSLLNRPGTAHPAPGSHCFVRAARRALFPSSRALTPPKPSHLSRPAERSPSSSVARQSGATSGDPESTPFDRSANRARPGAPS